MSDDGSYVLLLHPDRAQEVRMVLADLERRYAAANRRKMRRVIRERRSAKK